MNQLPDLSGIEYQDTFDWRVTTPSGDKLDWIIVIASPSHPQRSKAEDKSYRRLARERNRNNGQMSEDPDEVKERLVEHAVKCTVAWKNAKGESIDGFSPTVVAETYGRPKLGWLLRAVIAQAAKDENFIRSSSEN
jgi:hypothetical protein